METCAVRWSGWSRHGNVRKSQHRKHCSIILSPFPLAQDCTNPCEYNQCHAEKENWSSEEQNAIKLSMTCCPMSKLTLGIMNCQTGLSGNNNAAHHVAAGKDNHSFTLIRKSDALDAKWKFDRDCFYVDKRKMSAEALRDKCTTESAETTCPDWDIHLDMFIKKEDVHAYAYKTQPIRT